MRYNLACYECQLGNLGRARAWLDKAVQLPDAAKLKLAALEDPDLQPLWTRFPDPGGSGATPQG